MNETALARARALISRGGRRILGLVGPPGAGKSTVARQLVDALDGAAVLLPMDGFHLANVELARLGRAGRKGAPDTFDAGGYIALLQRVRDQQAGRDGTVYAPEFRREIEEPIASAIPIPADVPLVVTEGNYLLLERDGWAGVKPLLDEVWYVDVDDALRRRQLIERHMRFGRSEAEARAWEAGTDQPNAKLIGATAARADWRCAI
jgi:pantothenate kinase